MEREQIRDLMHYHLRNSFDLFEESHKINVHPRESSVCINYRTTAQTLGKLRGTTHFDIQVTDNVCFILWVELERSKKGKELGWQLYETIHNFSKDFRCRSVRTTASGWTLQGKTRRQYLLERGYVPFGENEVELIL